MSSDSQEQRTNTGSLTGATPVTEPWTDMGERSLTARWAVGEPNSEGLQTHAQLYATYFKGRGYLAQLTQLDIREAGIYTEEHYDLGFNRPQVTIPERSASRFNRNTLSAVYAEALEALRARFANGEVDVVRFFEGTIKQR